MLENVVKQQTCLRRLWCTSHCSGFVEKKSISCVDCVGMSSLVLVRFIEFCLASCNDEAVNIPVIILASFSLLLVCACTLLKSCVSVKLHICCACSQCLGVSGHLVLYFRTFQLCVMNTDTCSLEVPVRLSGCSSSSLYFCRA